MRLMKRAAGAALSLVFSAGTLVMMTASPASAAIPTDCSGSFDKVAITSANWADANGWLPSGVPTGTDDVCIGNGYTKTVNANATISGSVTVADGTLETLAGRSLGATGGFSFSEDSTAYLSGNIFGGPVAVEGDLFVGTPYDSTSGRSVTIDANFTLASTGTLHVDYASDVLDVTMAANIGGTIEVSSNAVGSITASTAPYQFLYRSSGSLTGATIKTTFSNGTIPATFRTAIGVLGYGLQAEFSLAAVTTPTPDDGSDGTSGLPAATGYTLYSTDGGAFAFGSAEFKGSLGGKALNAPIVGGAGLFSGTGYYLAAADGGVFAFGDAPFEGSLGGKPLNAPIVDITLGTNGGYYLVAADGGVFAFGDAPFLGSMGGKPLNSPIVSIIADYSDSSGYALVAADGGVFNFDSEFKGSIGGKPLNSPIVDATPDYSDGVGYTLVAADGGVFNFGSEFEGSLGGTRVDSPVTAIYGGFNAGYYVVTEAGGVYTFPASDGEQKPLFHGALDGQRLAAPIVGFSAN